MAKSIVAPILKNKEAAIKVANVVMDVKKELKRRSSGRNGKIVI